MAYQYTDKDPGEKAGKLLMMRKRNKSGEIYKKVTSAPHFHAIPRSKHVLDLKNKALTKKMK